MAWPISSLTATHKDVIRAICRSHEPWLRSEISEWPKDGCADTVATVLDDIREALGVRGFRWKVVSGWFGKPGDYGFRAGHVWIEIADGTIIDPTAGQFIEGPALQFFAKGDHRYFYKRYSRKRDEGR